jgi:ribosomal protein S6
MEILIDPDIALAIYQIQKNSAGIYVVAEFQSVQFEVRLILLKNHFLRNNHL